MITHKQLTLTDFLKISKIILNLTDHHTILYRNLFFAKFPAYACITKKLVVNCK